MGFSGRAVNPENSAQYARIWVVPQQMPGTSFFFLCSFSSLPSLLDIPCWILGLKSATSPHDHAADATCSLAHQKFVSDFP